MRYTWIDEFLLNKIGVTKNMQKDWNWIRYKVGGKMFAAICLEKDNNQPYYITLKLEPVEGEFLRHQYEDILPGYYMNKAHWNSIKPDGEVPDDLLKDLLEKSYWLVLRSLSKKRQREIIALSCCGTNCMACSFYGDICKGCNELRGKVFHAPEGKACPIYSCASQKNKNVTCANCSQLPCNVWRNTRDPQMSDEQFESSIKERITSLKNFRIT